MLDTKKLTPQENINLVKEIAMIAPTSTPFATLLMSKGKVKPTAAKIHTWREKTLDGNTDITVPEGSQATNFAESVRKELNNVCEIFMKSVEVSGTAQSTGAVGDLFSQEVADRLAEMKISIEKRLINGTKDDGASSGTRKMGGILQFIDAANQITGATKGVLTEQEVKNLVRALFMAGNENGEFYALVNADIKDQIDNLYKGNYQYQHVTNEFGLIVNTIDTSYGRIHFVLDRYAPVDKIIAFDVNALSIANLRAPHFEALAKTGDSVRGMVVAESTLEVSSPKAVALYTLKA